MPAKSKSPRITPSGSSTASTSKTDRNPTTLNKTKAKASPWKAAGSTHTTSAPATFSSAATEPTSVSSVSHKSSENGLRHAISPSQKTIPTLSGPADYSHTILAIAQQSAVENRSTVDMQVPQIIRRAYTLTRTGFLTSRLIREQVSKSMD